MSVGRLHYINKHIFMFFDNIQKMCHMQQHALIYWVK